MATASLPNVTLREPYRPKPMLAYFQAATLQTPPKTRLYGKVYFQAAQ
jgi:hypothetical protein